MPQVYESERALSIPRTVPGRSGATGWGKEAVCFALVCARDTRNASYVAGMQLDLGLVSVQVFDRIVI